MILSGSDAAVLTRAFNSAGLEDLPFDVPISRNATFKAHQYGLCNCIAKMAEKHDFVAPLDFRSLGLSLGKDMREIVEIPVSVSYLKDVRQESR